MNKNKIWLSRILRPRRVALATSSYPPQCDPPGRLFCRIGLSVELSYTIIKPKDLHLWAFMICGGEDSNSRHLGP